MSAKKNSKKPLILYLVRHGEAEERSDSTDERDPPLTDLGRKQAQKIAQRLADEKFDHIYYSPLQRACQTAKYALEKHERTPATETSEVKELSSFHFLSSAYQLTDEESRFVEYECDVMQRFVNRIRHEHNYGEKILVVSHGNFIRTIMPVLGGRNPSESLLMEINNASLSVLEVWASGISILRFGNSLRHLEEDEVTI
ncbi:hypothetical protein BVX94_00630 [bacterium B17]|nr:hypothetical protein BVX94_00630 [bacterium B17]